MSIVRSHACETGNHADCGWKISACACLCHPAKPGSFMPDDDTYSTSRGVFPPSDELRACQLPSGRVPHSIRNRCLCGATDVELCRLPTRAFSNGLSDAEEERLRLLAEECAEVVQVCMKILRHGYSSSHPDRGPLNRELLEKELGHVLHAYTRMTRAGDVLHWQVSRHQSDKASTINQWLHHQSTVGDKKS